MIYIFCSLSPQSGKSTCADYFAEKIFARRMEFSLPIEIMAKTLYGYDGNKSDPNQRKILQDLGLSSKIIDPHYWCWRVLACATSSDIDEVDFDALRFSSIDNYKKWFVRDWVSKFKNIVISGLRSPEEADFFKDLGAKVYLVVRNFQEDSSMQWKDHKVESQLRGYNRFDSIIENSGTIEDLKAEVDFLIDRDWRS